jgi:hypothetical protein
LSFFHLSAPLGAVVFCVWCCIVFEIIDLFVFHSTGSLKILSCVL